MHRRWPLIVFTAVGGAILLGASFAGWYGVYIAQADGPLTIAGALVVCFGAAASAALGGRRRSSMAWS